MIAVAAFAFAGYVVAVGPTTQSARVQSHQIGNYSGAFSDYYAGVLYRAGKYAQAAALAQGLLDYGGAGKPAASADLVRQASLVKRLGVHQGKHGSPVVLAIQVQAMRRWVRGEAQFVAFVPKAARVMGWTSEDLIEVTPQSIVASGPGGSELAVVPTLMPATVISSSEVRTAAAAAEPVAAVAVVMPSEKLKPGALTRPAALGAGGALKRVREHAAASGKGSGSGRLDEWMERAFTN